MNILFYDMSSYTRTDLQYYLKKAGHNCKTAIYKFRDLYNDDFFERRFSQYMEEVQYDCVMSINFFPLVAKLCYKHNIKYLAWSYDSPIVHNHLEYYAYPTNYIFLFDREEVAFFRNKGLDRFHHLPLAVNTQRLKNIPISSEDRERYSCDISFIGQFYQSPLKDLLLLQDDYTKGYINAIADAQLKVYGYNFVEELIPDSLLDTMNHNFEKANLHIYESGGEQLSREGLIHSVNKQVTRTERIILLKLLSQKYNVHLYSTESIDLLKDIPYKGTADYFEEMPKIFRLSRINLNPTLKSIHSGIPLRALDIMGSKGFLLSNFQPELAEYFQPDVDIALYDSIEDALYKAEYYLTHEDERLALQENAYHIIEEKFSYPERIAEMFRTAGLL